MKKIVFAALMLSAVSAHAGNAQQNAAASKACNGLAANIKAVAQQRDKGVPKETIVQMLKSQPFTPTIGLVMAGTNDVYNDKHMTPDQLESRYRQQCLQQFTAK